MGLLSLGARALQANQVALQTAGNNISNVNTPGYSRQKVVLQTVPGQFSGGGFVGNGVGVLTIQRNFDAFLNRQATIATATQSSDKVRSDYLRQLEGVFDSGPQGMGAAISDMLNAFSDVANAPTDLTARTVVLTRVQETTARMRATSQRLDDLQVGIAQSLKEKVSSINSLAQSIASVNQQIARVKGAGQPPNDLLDQRDQLLKELNTYVQTTTLDADDGSLSVYIGGSQELVRSNNASTVALTTDDFGDPNIMKLAMMRNGQPLTVDENMLGGGSVAGLLRFQNSDLTEGRNLLGRLTLAVTTSMNDQHKLGLDLNGNVGGNLFSTTTFGTFNVMEPMPPAAKNNAAGLTGASAPTLFVIDPTKFQASDYDLQITATGFNITRLSDGKVFNETQLPPLSGPITTNPNNPNPYTVLAEIDGLQISDVTLGAISPVVGDRYRIKPFSTSASVITSAFSDPKALAVASPLAGVMGTTNTGSLQLTKLTSLVNPPTATLTTSEVFTFTTTGSYTLLSEGNAIAHTYTPGQAISNAVGEWAVTLQGTPGAGDTFTVSGNAYPRLSAGNATAMLDLRDVAMFDGAAMTDGYAGLISQLGIRAQSASYAAQVSEQISTGLEHDRAGVSGVNLDEEAASLLQYQQAYQASAKMIQIANGIFDTLMQSLGR